MNHANPSISLGGESGTLQNMTVRARTYPFMEKNEQNESVEVSHISCHVRDLPLRRWVHIAVCARDKAIDVFVNGRLAHHAESPQPILNSTGPLYINQNGGFDGFISKLHYGNYYLNKD